MSIVAYFMFIAILDCSCLF